MNKDRPTLRHAELNCAIKQIANILNGRPQRTKSFSLDEDFLEPVNSKHTQVKTTVAHH